MAILEVLADITGWLSDNEAEWLNHQAAKVKNACIVEIGSYQGKSTIALALNATVPVFAIDPHEDHIDEIGGAFGSADRARFHENIVQAGVQERVCPINLASRQAQQLWSKPIGLLFVDGAHNYIDCRFDCFAYLDYVVEGGILAVHDRTWPDIERVLNELKQSQHLAYLETCDSLVAFRKV